MKISEIKQKILQLKKQKNNYDFNGSSSLEHIHCLEEIKMYEKILNNLNKQQ
jgi:hypothetical protein